MQPADTNLIYRVIRMQGVGASSRIKTSPMQTFPSPRRCGWCEDESVNPM